MRNPPVASLLVTLLLFSIGFAGCTDPDRDGQDGDDGTPTGSPSSTENGGGSRELVAGAKPLWFLGLQWTYAIDHPYSGVEGDVTLALVAETDEVWQVAPTNDSDPDALLWSLFVHLPPLGAVAKADLSPHIHGTPVSWFSFPLTDGKTWQGADHHGTQVNYTATATETTLPGGRSASAFEIVGERAGTPWVRFVYSAEVGWFNEASVDGDGDGTADLTMTLKSADAGTAHLDTPTFDPRELAVISDAGPESLVEPATAFTVPEGADELYVFFVLGGGPGRYTGSVTLPSGTIESFNYTNTNQSFMVDVRGARFSVAPGEGNVGSVILGDGFVFGEVFAIVRTGP